DPVARNILNYYPRANQPGDPGTQRNNFYNTGTSEVDTDNADIRIDHNLTATQRLFGRFSYRHSLDGPRALFPGDLAIAEGRIAQNDFGRNFVTDYTNTLSPNTLLNLRFSFARNRFLYANQGLGFVPSSLGLPKSFDTAVDRLMFPRVDIGGEVSL